MSSSRVVVIVVALILTATLVFADRDCKYSADREAVVAADGVSRVEIDAGAGFLKVRGAAGLEEIRAAGEACSSKESRLDEVDIETHRRGDTVIIEVVYPHHTIGSGNYQLDLTVDLPSNLSVEIDDSSGFIEVTAVAGVDVDDSSGGIEIRDIAGDVEVEDGSGDVEVFDVKGSVEVEDGSGDVEIERVEGDVLIGGDGSGDILVSHVTGDLRVDDDGSGNIRVVDISGDFVVEDDGSGSIRYKEVGGKVRLPDDD